MATLTKSVSPQGGGYNYTYTVDVIENSTSIANNTSNVTIDFYIKGPWAPSYYDWTTYYGIIVDGSIKDSGSSRPYVSTSNVKLLSWTGDVAHNSDGSKSISVSVYLTNGSASYLPTQYPSSSPLYMGSVSLTTIPRASSVSCSTADIGSNATISISRASSSFTHTLSYSFGSLTGTIATKTSSTSVSWTIPTTFYAQIPNDKSGTGTITCYTYNGSTLIGSKPTSFTATVNESASKPTLNPTAVDSNATTTALTGDSSKFIKYYSNAAVSTGASARNSATLKSQKITCGAKSISSASGTINAVESGSFTFSATDSRGYPTTQTVKKTLIEYIKLTCSLNAGAPTTAGVATLKISGNYFNGSFGKVANTLTVQYRYKTKGGSYGSWTTVTATKSGNTYSATATISGLNYQTTYVFQARATDKLATKNTNEQTRRTTPVFDWSKDDFRVNGDFRVTGATTLGENLTGKSLTGTWLQSTEATDLEKAPPYVCVFDANGWLYKRTPAELKSDMGVVTPKDYVVERGTSSSWNYEKWNSGIVKAWKQTTSSNLGATQDGGVNGWYYRIYTIALPSGMFKTITSAMCNCHWGTGISFASARNVTTTSFEAVYLSNQNGGAGTFWHEVIGTWK